MPNAAKGKMAEPLVKRQCTNCDETITGIHVHCAECDDFILCLQCFAAGAEIGQHKNDHKYQLMGGPYQAQKFTVRNKGNWSDQEEVHLLGAIDKFGFGNWEDISMHIETRSPEDAKEKYITKFLNGPIGRHTWKPAASLRPNITDHTVNVGGPLSASAMQRLPPLEVTPEEASELGYIQNRNDFEPEYDSTAEELISSLSLSADDQDVDIILKLAQLDMYTRRLRERTRRKRLVRDYQLIYKFFRGNNLMKRELSKTQRNFRERFRVFAQFYTANEFDRLLSSFEREKALRIRLSELYRYRWNGLTKFDEMVHFEQHAAVANNKNTGPYGQYGKTEREANGELLPLYMHYLKEKRGEKITNLNSTVLKSMHHIDDQHYSDGLLLSKSYSDNYDDILSVKPEPESELPEQLLQEAPVQLGSSLLTSNESQLCSKLHITPTTYFTIKTVLLSGAPCANDSDTDSPIRKYLTKAGWLFPQMISNI